LPARRRRALLAATPPRAHRPSGGGRRGEVLLHQRAAAAARLSRRRCRRARAPGNLTQMGAEAGIGAATEVVDLCDRLVAGAWDVLAKQEHRDEEQVLAYELAHLSAAVEAARSMLAYGAHGETEEQL